MLNSRVASVDANKVTVVNSLRNETSEIPFGACVWATGVAMHPLIKELQARHSFPPDTAAFSGYSDLLLWGEPQAMD